MIVKLTVNDNDFYSLISGFMKNFYSNAIMMDEDYYNGLDANTRYFEMEKYWELSKLLNPNIDTEWTNERKEILVTAIKRGFHEYAKRRVDAKTLAYLDNELRVSIIKAVEDKWENGEVFYWFQHSNTFINQ